MKTKMKKIAIVALMFGTLSSYGIETVTHNTNESRDVRISHKKANQHWTIKNSKGKAIYQQEGEVKKSTFEALQLEDGHYTLEIERGFEIQVTPLSVKNGITSLKKEQVTTIHKPVFRKENNKVLVSQLAVDSKALEVKIYYEENIIFHDVVTGGNVLGRVYKLRKDIKDDYKVVMKANDRIYINEFSL